MSDDQTADYRVGLSIGVFIRGLVLGLLLAVAVVGVIGHDSSTQVFRYEGF